MTDPAPDMQAARERVSAFLDWHDLVNADQAVIHRYPGNAHSPDLLLTADDLRTLLPTPDQPPAVLLPTLLLRGIRDRIRHDHTYPYEISTSENPHRCPGCEIEDHLDSLLNDLTETT